MKLLFFISFFFITICYNYAQPSLLEKKITLEKHSGTIEQIIKEIGEKADFYFTYSNNQIPLDKRVFFISRTQTVKSLLDFIFKDCGIEYVERYNKIILKPLNSSLKMISIKGQVKDKSCGDAVSNVNIKVVGTGYGGISDDKGKFTIQIPAHKNAEKFQLAFSHLAYKSDTLIVKRGKLENIVAQINMNILNLPEIKIFGVPQIAYGNTEFQIYDYELFYDKILLIVYEKRLSKSNLLLMDKEIKLSCIKEVSGTPVGMYKDCIGNVNLITFYYPYKVSLNAGCLSIKHAKQDWMNRITKPCVTQSGNGLYFYYFYGPARLSVDFSFYNPITKVDSVFRQIKDTASLNELKNKLESSANTTNFTNSRGSMADIKFKDWDGGDKENFEIESDEPKDKTLYTPMLFIKDSLYIFNHCEGKIEVYSTSSKFKRSVQISYNKLSGWKRKIFLDKGTNRVYTCFWKTGHYEVNEIDLNTGEMKDACKINFAWIDKIQIFEGNIYYLYKSAQYNYKKCLYKQKL